MPRRFVPLLLLLPALLLFWKLDYAPFWNPDEGRYAAASYEMAFPFDGKPADWVVPHLNTMARLNKPPLVYWTAASFFRFFGPSEITGRLPAALAALGIAIILFFWGRRAFGLRAGICSALVWITMMFPFAMARVLNTDMLLTFAIAVSTYGIWLAFRGREQVDQDSKWLFWGGTLVAGSGMGLALLAKGPVGLAMPLVSAFIYIICSNGWRRAPWGMVPMVIIIALAIGVPWFILAQQRRSDFLEVFLLQENLGRFSGKEEYHTKTPLFFYLPICLVGMVPWTGFLFTALTQWMRDDAERKARLFLFVYAGFIVGFFSLSSTKLISYVLPAFPAFALIIGAGLARWEWQEQKWRASAVGSTVLLYLVVIALGSIFLSDEKTVPLALARPYITALAIILLAASIGLLLSLRRPDARRLMGIQVGSAAVLFVLLLNLAGKISRYEDVGALTTAIAPLLKSEDKVVGFGTYGPTTVFYTRRPAYFFGFKNTSGLREDELENSKYFPDYKTPEAGDSPEPDAGKLAEMLKSNPRVFVLTSEPLRLPPDLQSLKPRFWGRNNDYYLYANFPKPANFDLMYVAPRTKKANRTP
jgi:4-amino-4-deoxy-L-arabinose transferase-like glycosyltransferase